MLTKILAHLGVPWAMYELGEDYFNDDNDEKALYWFKKAIDKGQVVSYSFIASIYRDMGEDHQLDYYEWLQKAVNVGDISATNEMARLCRFGIITHKQTKRAAELYKKAADKGCSHAKEMLEEMLDEYDEGKDAN